MYAAGLVEESRVCGCKYNVLFDNPLCALQYEHVVVYTNTFELIQSNPVLFGTYALVRIMDVDFGLAFLDIFVSPPPLTKSHVSM